MLFEVTYAYRNQFGDDVVTKGEFESWGEEGKYTLLYEKRDGEVSVIIPTKNVSIMERVSENTSPAKLVLKTKRVEG